MKNLLLILSIVISSAVTFEAHAIPPVPPTSSESSVFEEEVGNVVCRDLNSLTDEEIDFLNSSDDNHLIVSYYPELRYICYKTQK